MGTNNVDSAAHFGYAKAQEALRRSFGLKALPIEVDSPRAADVILVVESDITSTVPVFGLNVMRAARDFKADLILVNPRFLKLSRHADEWLRNKPGTSVAILNGMMKVILDEEEKLPRFAELRQSLEQYTPEKVEEMAGIAADQLSGAARRFARAEKRLLCLTIGDIENNKGMDTALAAANLLLLVGSRPEALQMPPEYSNTLGMFEAGVRPDAGAGHRPLDEPGLTVEDMLYAEDSSVKALYVMGENPMVSFPRVHEVEKKLAGMEFLVVQDVSLTETAKMADVVLPSSSWAEKEGTFVGATGIPQRIVKSVPETGSSIADWKIIRNLARVMQEDLGHGDLGSITEEVARTVRFEYDASSAEPSFNPVEFKHGEVPDADYPFAMVTGILMQHSGDLTVLSRSLGSVYSDAYLEINQTDARKMNLEDDSYVKVTSRRGEVFLKARITHEVPQGMVFVPAHFPHAKVNALTYPSRNGEPHIVAARVEPAT
jgi:predicted molibdopterin-dependent oxidoreductase YjgC